MPIYLCDEKFSSKKWQWHNTLWGIRSVVMFCFGSFSFKLGCTITAISAQTASGSCQKCYTNWADAIECINVVNGSGRWLKVYVDSSPVQNPTAAVAVGSSHFHIWWRLFIPQSSSHSFSSRDLWPESRESIVTYNGASGAAIDIEQWHSTSL